MANGGFFSRLRGQSETTGVSKETEVGIPWKTYVLDSLRANIFVLGSWVIGWAVWACYATESRSFWWWVTRRWGPWIARWWYLILISFVFCWIGTSNWAYGYRLKIEQIIKNPPLYDNADPGGGAWHPFVNWRRRRIENASLRQTYREKFGRKDRE